MMFWHCRKFFNKLFENPFFFRWYQHYEKAFNQAALKFLWLTFQWSTLSGSQCNGCCHFWFSFNQTSWITKMVSHAWRERIYKYVFTRDPRKYEFLRFYNPIIWFIKVMPHSRLYYAIFMWCTQWKKHAWESTTISEEDWNSGYLRNAFLAGISAAAGKILKPSRLIWSSY